MPVRYHINETDIYKFIADEFNDNSSGDKVKFSIGYYFFDDESGVGKFTKRFTQNGGRFDVKKTMDDDTYALKDDSFVPMGVYNLNANYLAHDEIKEITYEPNLEFLVYVENDVAYTAIILAIQEVRARLIQYQTTLDVEFLNLEGGDNITETLKVIAMAGEIDFGEIRRLQGKNYLSVSIPLTLEVTNYGEYANQEIMYLSVESVEEGAFVKIPLLSWNYGVGIDTDGSQTLNDKSPLLLSIAKQVRHVPKTTVFGISMAVQIDFKNPILYKIFRDSRLPTQVTSVEKWKVRSTISVYNQTSKTYVIDDDLTINDFFLLDKKSPISELSKGEKIVYALTFLPYWEKEA